jgi:peroxiredoxin
MFMMSNHEDYQYQEQWKRKPRIGWKQVGLAVGVLLALIALINIIPQFGVASLSGPTPTTAYIEYGSRRFPSVIPQEVDFPAPELEISDLNGDPVSLADYRDKVVLVNTWATWCPGCEAEMPELQAFSQTHQEADFIVIAVNAEETADQLIPFVEKQGLTFPIWLDAKKDVYRVFKSRHLPSSYVIDRSGTVRLAWYGPISKEVLEIYVTPLLYE